MKRCPSCNRTYADDSMANCMHDGAPLMSAAYSPPGPPAAAMPQGYPPPPGYPPPQGYAPPSGAPWQNYPPGSYPQQNHPPPSGWQAGTGEFVPCPRCARPDPEKLKFTWWGGMLGPRMLSHVKCSGCGLAYNGKTGQSNNTKITVYVIVTSIFFFGVFLLLFFGFR